MKTGNSTFRFVLISILFFFNGCESLYEFMNHTPKDNDRKMNKIRDGFLSKDSLVFSLFDSYNICFGILGINEKRIEYKIYFDRMLLKDTVFNNNEFLIDDIHIEIDSIIKIKQEAILRNKAKYNRIIENRNDSTLKNDKKVIFRKKNKSDSIRSTTFLRVSYPNKQEVVFSTDDIQGFPNLYKIWDFLKCRLD